MELQDDELIMIYDGIVKNSGHPDPVGYMARAFLLSEFDPDFSLPDGTRGFMPVHPEFAYTLTGTADITSLEANLMTTLAMDLMIFERYGRIEDMMIKFHAADLEATEPNHLLRGILGDMKEAKEELSKFLNPRPATVKDVVEILKSIIDLEDKATKDQKEIFKKLIATT